MIDSIYAISSPFTLTLNHSFSPAWDTLHIRLLIRANTALSFTAGALKARFAITEDSIWFFAPPGSNTEKTFYKVCKKMIPGAGGLELRSQWTENQLDSVVIDFPMITYMSNLNNLSLAAFVQNDETKSVLQTVLSPPQKLPDYALIDPLNSLQFPPVQCSDTMVPSNIVFTNAGTNTLLNCMPGYSVDGGPYNSYQWTGNLEPGASASLPIPPTYLGSGMHTIRVRVLGPNLIGIQTSRLAYCTNTISVQKTSTPPPLHEYFMSTGFPYQGWAVYNQSKDGNTWKWVKIKMATTNFMLPSLQLRWFVMNPGTVNELYLPAIDAPGTGSLVMSFDMVYASFGELSHDTLKVMASTDCGLTWHEIFSGQGQEIQTSTMDQFEYNTELPDTTAWARHTVDLGSYAGIPRLLLKIRAISNVGNDMYLRNIYVGSSLGIGAITAHGFSVYPDPVATTGNIEFMQDLSGELNLRIMDLKGQVMKQTHTSVPAGFVHLSFDVSGLDPGVYFLELSSARDTWRKKIVVLGE